MVFQVRVFISFTALLTAQELHYGELVRNACACHIDPSDFLVCCWDADMKNTDLLYVIKEGVMPVHSARILSVLNKYSLKASTDLIIRNTDKIRLLNESAIRFRRHNCHVFIKVFVFEV